MATIINNPDTSQSSGMNTVLLGILLVVLLALAAWAFGGSYLRRLTPQQTAPAVIDNTIEQPQAPQNSGTKVTIPDQIDVNVNTSPQGTAQ